mgnify:FL=1
MINRYFLIILAAQLISISGQAQMEMAPRDSLVVTALQDEMERNMSQLQEEGYNRPFFIAYTMADVDMQYAIATLGAIVSAEEMQERNWFTRLIVGDYAINDENFNNSFGQITYPSNYEPLPIDTDYWGIRRAFWLATNNVYKSAARKYKQKMKTINEYEMDYTLPDFSRENAVKYYQPAPGSNTDIAELKSRARSLSKYFTDQKNIVHSGVFATQTNVQSYFVNTEGTAVVKPHNYSTIAVTAQCLAGDDVPVRSQIQYIGRFLHDLPDDDQIETDISVLLNDMRNKLDAEPLKEQYIGPVLIEGPAVASFFMKAIFHNRSGGILSNRPVLSNENENDIKKYIENLEEARNPESSGMIAADFITISAIPRLVSFEGKTLYGQFEVDSEGVMPNDTLDLIKNGEVVSHLNGRTPSPTELQSNGYNRLVVGASNLNKQLLPGNLLVSVGETATKEDLKNQMIDLLKEEQLNYGIHVSSLPVSADKRPNTFFKIDANTGEETPVLISGMHGNQRNNKILREVIAATDEYKVYNFLVNGSSGFSMNGMATDGTMVSLIVPSAILLESYYFSSFDPDNSPFEMVIPLPE